jgi:hypothetical protein
MGDSPLASVVLAEDKSTITFTFENGTEAVFRAEGDCCSSSWIEHLDVPPDAIGEKLIGIADGGAVPWDGHECTPRKEDADGYAYGNECGHDSLSVYNTRFRTAKGDIVLEYRNDSNGYYGGYLVRVNG